MKLSELREWMHAWPEGLDPTDQEGRNAYFRSMGLEPGEIYQELEMDSHFVNTHRDISAANMQVGLHSHSFYELLYCRSDSNVEYLVGAERYRLQKGDVIIVPPGVSHRPLIPEQMPHPYVRDVVWISTEFMNQIRRWFPELVESAEVYSSLLYSGEDIQETLGNIFEQGIREAESRSEDWEMAVIGNTITLLVQLRRAFADRAVRPVKAEKPELLDRVLRYIEDNLDKKITLADAAHYFFVSESTITQLFRKRIGVSFYHCVTQRRLIAAKAMIDQGIGMETISERVGFSDYSTFYRAFKKEYGICPAQYRKLQNHNGY